MYIDGFSGKEDIIAQFQAPVDALDNAVILYAKYRTGNYEGSAFVLYQINDTLYEVHGSHCSCNGLEGQWSPEETSFKDLEFRWFQKNDMPYVCENEEDVWALKELVIGVIAERDLLIN